jgi:hypothetical protein
MPGAGRYGISTDELKRSSKGIAGNGGASRVWKGEIMPIAFAFRHLLSRCLFLYLKSTDHAVNKK